MPDADAANAPDARMRMPVCPMSACFGAQIEHLLLRHPPTFTRSLLSRRHGFAPDLPNMLILSRAVVTRGLFRRSFRDFSSLRLPAAPAYPFPARFRMSRLFLAPMEGLADYVLRDVLTGTGGFDGCVSEFVRVTGSVLPERVYERETPEVLDGGRTPQRHADGDPVARQRSRMDGAECGQAASLSPHGVDLNFGCPAKIVNRHGGGAMLLAHPEQLNRIVSAVRAAVPAEHRRDGKNAARRVRYVACDRLRHGARRRRRGLSRRACQDA